MFGLQPTLCVGVGHGQARRVRLVIARCSVDSAGRLSAHLPVATRVLVVTADCRVLVDSDSLSYSERRSVAVGRRGVLLLNGALTVTADAPKSHVHLWKGFVKHLLRQFDSPAVMWRSSFSDATQSSLRFPS